MDSEPKESTKESLLEESARRLAEANGDILANEPQFIGSYVPLDILYQALRVGVVPEKIAIELGVPFHRRYASSWNGSAISAHDMPLTHHGYPWTTETLETVTKVKEGRLTFVMVLAKKSDIPDLKRPQASIQDRGHAPPVPSELTAPTIPANAIIGLVLDDVYWHKINTDTDEQIAYTSKEKFPLVVRTTVDYIKEVMDKLFREQQITRGIPIYGISGALLWPSSDLST